MSGAKEQNRETVGRVDLRIKLLSYWHVGSGLGRGADLDALVLKDRDGLPYLPGRTLKGLLREAMQSCEEAGQIKEGRTHELFGKPAEEGKYDGSTPGALAFDDGRLNEEERTFLASSEGSSIRSALFDRFSSTSLDDKGMAQDKTLRTIELCVPLELQARISLMDSVEGCWISDLKKACLLLKSLGSHRNRGLGRCSVSLNESGITDTGGQS